MRNSTNTVLGLGFGDEGKGVVTDYLVSLHDEPKDVIVARFSGGQQAGHTVCIGDKRHTFSNIGSGTLRGAATYWSRFCTLDPRGLSVELSIILNKYDLTPTIYIDPEAPVTTPLDKIHNQSNISNREDGTCGVGVGTTWQREEDHYSLVYRDLHFPHIRDAKLKLIERYYLAKGIIMSDGDRKDFIRMCDNIVKAPNIHIADRTVLDRNDVVFEGSQGLLLDKDLGFFPHVTRSNVSTLNIGNMHMHPGIIWGVTRAYSTRHGTGPFHTVDTKCDPGTKENNKYNKFQGEFRTGVLNLDWLKYGIDREPYIRKIIGMDNFRLVITCMDQIRDANDFRYIAHQEVQEFAGEKGFLEGLCEYLDIDREFVYLNSSPESQTIEPATQGVFA